MPVEQGLLERSAPRLPPLPQGERAGEGMGPVRRLLCPPCQPPYPSRPSAFNSPAVAVAHRRLLGRQVGEACGAVLVRLRDERRRGVNDGCESEGGRVRAGRQGLSSSNDAPAPPRGAYVADQSVAILDAPSRVRAARRSLPPPEIGGSLLERPRAPARGGTLRYVVVESKRAERRAGQNRR